MARTLRHASFGLICSLQFAIPAVSKNLGVHGPVFQIEEQNLLEVIENKLKLLEKSGKIDSINKRIISTVKSRALNPTPTDLPTTDTYKLITFDPSFIVQKDIKDHKGRFVAKAGAHINPLDHVSWGNPLILINGDDPDQVRWAKSIKKAKWVLVKGSPFKIAKEENRRVYFDQGGKIIKHFGINKVPSKITQKGKVLIIEELPPLLEGKQ